MTRLVSALLIGMLICGCNKERSDSASSHSPESPSRRESVTPTDVRISEAEIRELIEQLASPNKATNPESEPFVDYPQNYDHDAQKVVAGASAGLEKTGFYAIPLLIKNMDDKRYSCTRSYSILVDYSVGEECFRIVDSILNPNVSPDYSVLPKNKFKRVKGYPMRMGLDGEWDDTQLSYLDLLIHRDRTISRDANRSIQKSIQEWWNSESFKSIEHAHLAAVNRLIKHEQAIGFEKDVAIEKYLKPYFEFETKLEKRTQSNN